MEDRITDIGGTRGKTTKKMLNLKKNPIKIIQEIWNTVQIRNKT